jgi:YD repeat-containing protein
LLDKKVAGIMDKITYTYDALGNRASMVDESGESSYSYDENSRLKEIKKGGMSQVAYTYDAIGNAKDKGTEGQGDRYLVLFPFF